MIYNELSKALFSISELVQYHVVLAINNKLNKLNQINNNKLNQNRDLSISIKEDG